MKEIFKFKERPFELLQGYMNVVYIYNEKNSKFHKKFTSL